MLLVACIADTGVVFGVVARWGEEIAVFALLFLFFKLLVWRDSCFNKTIENESKWDNL